MQRTLASFQNEKIAQDRKYYDMEAETNNLKSQLTFEGTRY